MITFKEFLAEQAITTERGFVHYDWNTELEGEEGPDYLPNGFLFDKVLELKDIEVDEPGKGHGEALMKDFLNTPEAKEAHLIFLDPVPGMGKNFASGKSEEEQVQMLKKFYAKFGFRSRPGSNRMWLVLKGKIPDEQLPT